MSVRDDHLAFERILARVLFAADPPDALRGERSQGAVPAAFQDAAEAIDDDGLRLSALLVARLRFERLVQGSRHAGEWFERDPEGFAQAFRAYHASVAPTSHLPLDEARQFDAWRAERER